MSEQNNEIALNLDEINKKIETAAKKSGRKREDIFLLPVTKTIDTERIQKVFDYGINSFGENKVQEILDKYDKFPNDAVNWHLIGHLQTNKVKYIIDKVKLIHSVDSEKLAQEINKKSEALNKVTDVLVEVNISAEDSKFGIKPENTEEFIKKISKLKNIRIKGLMTVAPYVENSEENRHYFRELRKLSVDIAKENIDNVYMDTLSMGMTNDYEVAIEEGATIVRIGTGIFGKRNYM